MTKVQKPLVIYEYNQGAILLANNRQVGFCTKHFNICHTFIREMMEDKDVYIQYIRIKDNPEDIIKNTTSESDFVKHMNRITEEELWEIVDTGRDNSKNDRVTNDFINSDNTEYSSHAILEVVEGNTQEQLDIGHEI